MTIMNRHQCRKPTVLSCHPCLINFGVESDSSALSKQPDTFLIKKKMKKKKKIISDEFIKKFCD